KRKRKKERLIAASFEINLCARGLVHAIVNIPTTTCSWQRGRYVSETVEKNIKEKFFTIPCVNSVSKRFTPIANMCHCKLAFSIPNTLKKFIGKGKDQLDHLCNQNVVYKISCDDCDASYVGQTKRQLKTRLHEHVSDINKRSKSPTVITNHRIDQNHNFDWHNVEILDREASYNKRLISEMVHIKRQTHGLNKQNDTDSLPESYLNIIQSLFATCSLSLINIREQFCPWRRCCIRVRNTIMCKSMHVLLDD
ncbi:hypothetical protein ALC60_09904, partial [Trachymyrmex zeteki]